jgi:type II secretory pathway pseudopilin PulG
MKTQRVLHRRNDERARFTGFTLVELAVVVAMTALLAALIMPAMSSAKEKARRAVCKNNLHQLYIVVLNSANDNGDVVPSAADDIGNYHSIRLSDEVFTNLVQNYAGNSNIFSCPNLEFGGTVVGPNTHDAYGYVLGYSYLADNVVPSTKGSDSTTEAIKLSAVTATNELLADANYWTASTDAYSPLLQIAPHTAGGVAFSQGTGPTNSASLGAAGGNIEHYDGSVGWKVIVTMPTHSASSVGDAFGNW